MKVWKSFVRGSKRLAAAIPLPAALETLQAPQIDSAAPSPRGPLASARRGFVSALSFAHIAIARMDREAAVKRAAKDRPSPLTSRPATAAAARQRAAAQAAKMRAAAEAERADDQARAFWARRFHSFETEVARCGLAAASRVIFSSATQDEARLLLAALPDLQGPRVRVNPRLQGAYSVTTSGSSASPSFDSLLAAQRTPQKR